MRFCHGHGAGGSAFLGSWPVIFEVHQEALLRGGLLRPESRVKQRGSSNSCLLLVYGGLIVEASALHICSTQSHTVSSNPGHNKIDVPVPAISPLCGKGSCAQKPWWREDLHHLVKWVKNTYIPFGAIQWVPTFFIEGIWARARTTMIASPHGAFRHHTCSSRTQAKCSTCRRPASLGVTSLRAPLFGCWELLQAPDGQHAGPANTSNSASKP